MPDAAGRPVGPSLALEPGQTRALRLSRASLGWWERQALIGAEIAQEALQNRAGELRGSVLAVHPDHDPRPPIVLREDELHPSRWRGGDLPRQPPSGLPLDHLDRA